MKNEKSNTNIQKKMFYYIVITDNDLRIESRKKLGITCRHPKHRLDEYITPDVHAKYYKIVEFINCSLEQLKEIEKNILIATYRFGHNLDIRPNNECRYDIAVEDLYEKCKEYFTLEYIEYDSIKDIEFLNNDIDNVVDDDKLKHPTFFKSYEELCSLEKEMSELKRNKNFPSEFVDTKLHEFPFELRGYQPNIYKELSTQLSNHNKLNLNIMCGGGKTVLFQKYAFDNQSDFQHIIYCAPRLPLIRDMIVRWSGIFPLYKYVEISSSGSSYCICPSKLPNMIDKKLIIFVCNDSFQKLKEFIKLVDASKLLIIFDEAHYLCTNKKETHPLIITKDINCKYIFATATPIYGNYLKSDRIYMKDVYYFGNIICEFNDIAELIEQKFITPAKLIIGSTGENNVVSAINIIKDLIEQGKDLKPNTSVEQGKDLKPNTSVEQGKDLKPNTSVEPSNYKPNKILMYTNSVDSIDVAYKYIKSLGIKVYKVHSKQHNNQSELDSFVEEKDFSILVNCRMLSEGIDINTLDTVVFLDPRNSKEEIIQIIMRPRRYNINNADKIAHIIIPNETINYTTAITVIKVLHKNNDPIVHKFVESIRSNSKSTKKLERKIADIQFVSDCEYKIIELTKEELCKEKTLPDLIIDALENYGTLSIDELLEVINSNVKDITSVCATLYPYSIGREKRNSIYYYYIENRSQISTDEFIDVLKEQNIYNESTYREKYSRNYNSKYPLFPEDTYEGFSFNLLNDVECSLENLREKIDVLLKNITINNELKKTNAFKERLIILKKYDPTIPSDLSYLKLKPEKIHSVFKLFGRYR